MYTALLVIILILALLSEYGNTRLIWILSDDKLSALDLILFIVLEIVFWPITFAYWDDSQESAIKSSLQLSTPGIV